MTIETTSSSSPMKQFDGTVQQHQVAAPLKSSADEDSCNDEILVVSSRNILRASDDGDSLPVITQVGTELPHSVSSASLTLPISQHLAPDLPTDELVMEVKKNQKLEAMIIDAVDDGPTPVESMEEFQLISSEWGETLESLIPAINVDKAKKEFAILHHMSRKIFTEKEGYDKDKPSKLLNYEGSLINSHNRWSDIRPWSHNIITLQTPILETGHHFKGFPVSYVNASHVKLDGRKFISCSAPQPASFEHYWQMVFEQGSDTIVMLTKLIEACRLKAHQYWLENIGEKLSFGKISVTLNSVEARKSSGELTDHLKEASIVKRTFKISCNGEPRTITHFHYREWPDMGRPSNTNEFITLMKEVYAVHKNGPIVTHCSAGVGRAGTFIIAYAYGQKIISDLKKSELPADFVLAQYTVNVPARVLKIREQRPDMVQKPDQYLFIKEVIATLSRTELQKHN